MLQPPTPPPIIRVTPARPAPGALVRISVRAGASAQRPGGALAGEPLHFERWPDGTWRAVGGVPTEAADSLALVVTLAGTPSGAGQGADTTWLRLPPPAAAARPREALRVDARFGRAPDTVLAARIAAEGARAEAVGRRAHETPRLWQAPFLRPREARVTSGFGTGRTFNGAVQARHTGVDFAGAVGAPVRAANRGVVALVDTFHLAGRVVYVDHGAGLVTAYFHLSRALVAVGDTVARGARIGLVGATGRVTGPHLHWAARYGAVTVNPLGLLALAAPDAPAVRAGSAPPTAR